MMANEGDTLNCVSCGFEIDEEYPACDDCGKVYFCDDCASNELKYGPLLMCEECSEEYHSAMEEYADDSERTEIGHRQGGRDPYKNDEEKP